MASPPSITKAGTPAADHNRGRFGPPPSHDGGWGGGQSDPGAPDYGQRLRRARLGVLCAAISILFLFLIFTAIFIARRGSSAFDDRTNTFITSWIQVSLPTGLLLVNSLILLVSTFTIEMARRTIALDVTISPLRTIPGVALGRERSFPWLVGTVALGIAFLCGQGMAWRKLVVNGFYPSSGASTSFVYLLTAAHAIHLSAGILVLMYCVAIYLLRRPVETRHIILDVTAWYWHFMFLLWLYIFVLLEFALVVR